MTLCDPPIYVVEDFLSGPRSLVRSYAVRSSARGAATASGGCNSAGRLWTELPNPFHGRPTGASTVSEEPDMETVVGLLDDEHVRTILRATNTQSLSARVLAARCDVSRQTVYRRLERLEDAGLVNSRPQLREDGHHDTVYTATLDRLSIELTGETFAFELERSHPDPSDELTKLWRNF